MRGILRSALRGRAGTARALHARTRGAAAAHAADADPVNHQRVVVALVRPAGRRIPPLRPRPEQLQRVLPCRRVLRPVRQLLVVAEHEHARPVVLVGDVLDLDADPRVLAHPLDLLPHSRERIEALLGGVVREVDRDDVGLIVAAAGEMAEL